MSITSNKLKKAISMTETVPFYASREWQDAFAIKSNCIGNLPRISKNQLRENSPLNFLTPKTDLYSLLQNGVVEEEYTSGTSGKSVRLIFGKNWWQEQEIRVLRCNQFLAKTLDLNPLIRRAVLSTPRCSGLSCYNRWLNQEQRKDGSSLIINQTRIPFNLSDTKLCSMAQEIMDWSPSFLDVDPVHGAWFALYCKRVGIHFPSLKFIITSYEFTSCCHRAIMEKSFGVPVIDLYGSSETGHILVENNGIMLPSPHTGILEIVDFIESGIGQLLITTLSNQYLPLIRYEVGDYIERKNEEYLIHGRIRDQLYSKNNKIITTRQIDNAFIGHNNIAHYQLRQSLDGTARLIIIRENPEEDSITEHQNLVSKIAELLGNMVTFEYTEIISPEESGKFRLTAHESSNV